MLIVFWNNGQLGNKLFYFAHFIAFSKETGSKIVCLFFKGNKFQYVKLFKGTKDNYIGFYPKPTFKSYGFIYRTINWLFYKLYVFIKKFNFNNKICSTYKSNIKGDYDSANYSIFNFINDSNRKKSTIVFYESGITWFDNTDLSKYYKEIKTFFTPVEPYYSNVKTYIHSLREEFLDSYIVGVHIRRGDYRDWSNGMWFFDDDAFILHMRKVSELLYPKNSIFVICSNEEIDLNKYDDFLVRKSTGHIIEDMYILSDCDYIIGPHSTYSMWASFYGQKPLYKMKKNKVLNSLNEFKIYNGRFYEKE